MSEILPVDLLIGSLLGVILMFFLGILIRPLREALRGVVFGRLQVEFGNDNVQESVSVVQPIRRSMQVELLSVRRGQDIPVTGATSLEIKRKLKPIVGNGDTSCLPEIGDIEVDDLPNKK